MISLVMMLGAGGINQAYLGVHFQNDLGVSLAVLGIALATLQLGALSGPLIFGWLSDKFPRHRVMQVSLLFSAVMTWLLARSGPELAMLLPILLFYGSSTYSRNTLTQAIVAFDVLGFSYIAGMLALLLMVDPAVARQHQAA